MCYCACVYETLTGLFIFILLFFNLWLNLLIIYFVIQEPLFNEGKQLLIINV